MFDVIARELREGRAVVVATVIQTAGSSPQKPGARMVVLADGTLGGTVGGGAFESQIVVAAREMLADAAATTRVLDFHLTYDLAMCCGGRMRAFLEKQPAADEALRAAREGETRSSR